MIEKFKNTEKEIDEQEFKHSNKEREEESKPIPNKRLSPTIAG